MYQSNQRLNEYANNLLRDKSTMAYFLAMKQQATENHETLFTNAMQNYITRLGLIIAKCNNESLRNNTYLGSIEYMCLKVIRSRQLYQLLKAVDVNSQGNAGKHTLGNVDIQIKECIHQYNNLIDSLVKATNITVLYDFKLTLHKKSNPRDIPLVDTKRDHVYSQITNVKYELKLCPDYTVDNYAKTIKSKFTVYWPEGHPGYMFKVILKATKTNRIIGSLYAVDISQANSKKAMQITINEADLDRRVLYAEATVTLLHKETHQYVTGALFWKKTNEYTNTKIVKTNKEKISAFYYPKQR